MRACQSHVNRQRQSRWNAWLARECSGLATAVGDSDSRTRRNTGERWCLLSPVHRDVVSDDESHQVFADNERATVGDACAFDEILHADAWQDDVRIDGQLRVDALEDRSGFRSIDVECLDTRDRGVVLQKRITCLKDLMDKQLRASSSLG